MILDRILVNKYLEVARRRISIPIDQLHNRALAQTSPRDFIDALKRVKRPALIAECKKASPSKGLLRPEYNPTQLARTYAQNGAAALSVLTDEQFFKGSLSDLTVAREAAICLHCGKISSSIAMSLQKARAAGADAVLLIVAALRLDQLRELHQRILELGMTPLVEVHDEAEVDIALKIEPKLIGVNNRNLRDFTVDLQTTARLRKNDTDGYRPRRREWNSHGRGRLASEDMGADAILVGERW
jgi:indole-3-glycerol phosphate synthase